LSLAYEGNNFNVNLGDAKYATIWMKH